MLALSERRLTLPGDVSVSGVDNIPEAAYFAPPLTTLRADFAAQGRTAVQELLGQINSTPLPPGNVLVSKLVPGDPRTCARYAQLSHQDQGIGPHASGRSGGEPEVVLPLGFPFEWLKAAFPIAVKPCRELPGISRPAAPCRHQNATASGNQYQDPAEHVRNPVDVVRHLGDIRWYGGRINLRNDQRRRFELRRGRALLGNLGDIDRSNKGESSFRPRH